MTLIQRHGHPWTQHEDRELLKSVRRERSADLQVFAKHHGRSEGAISSRLRLLARAEAGMGIFGAPWPGAPFEPALDYTRRQASGYSARAAEALWRDSVYASACNEIVGILVDAGYRVRAPSLEPHVDRHGEELPT